jgi:hypothetical protein
MAAAHTTVPDITVPGIGKRSTFQQLSRPRRSDLGNLPVITFAEIAASVA